MKKGILKADNFEFRALIASNLSRNVKSKINKIN